MLDFGIPGIRAPHTVAVVGAGMVGLATAKALESRGVEFDLFDQATSRDGRSPGWSHTFRSYGPDPSATGLLAESIQRWRDWETEMALPLYTRRGLVTLTFEEEMAGAAKAHFQRERSRLHEPSASHLRELLPGFRCSPDQVPLYDPWGGAIWNRAALRALGLRMRRRFVRCRIEAIEPLDDGRVKLCSKGTDRTYDAAVVAAGPGGRRLVAPLGFDLRTPRRAVLWTCRSVRPRYRTRVLVSLVGARYRGGLMYGFPVPANRIYAVGFRTLSGGPDGEPSPDEIGRAATDIQDWVHDTLPGLDPAPTGLFTSWVSGLPCGRVEPAGIRSHGAVHVPTGTGMPELAPVFGEALADVAQGKPLRSLLRPGDGARSPGPPHSAAP